MNTHTIYTSKSFFLFCLSGLRSNLSYFHFRKLVENGGQKIAIIHANETAASASYKYERFVVVPIICYSLKVKIYLPNLKYPQA